MLKAVAGIALTFAALVFVIVALSIRGTISFQLALLMLVALLGLYVGFGVLVAVYRFISKLD